MVMCMPCDVASSIRRLPGLVINLLNQKTAPRRFISQGETKAYARQQHVAVAAVVVICLTQRAVSWPDKKRSNPAAFINFEGAAAAVTGVADATATATAMGNGSNMLPVLRAPWARFVNAITILNISALLLPPLSMQQQQQQQQPQQLQQQMAATFVCCC